MAKKKLRRAKSNRKRSRRRNPSLHTAVNNRTGVRRYYINGRRVTRDKFDAAKFGRRVDTMRTVKRGKITRHHSEVRRKKR